MWTLRSVNRASNAGGGFFDRADFRGNSCDLEERTEVAKRHSCAVLRSVGHANPVPPSGQPSGTERRSSLGKYLFSSRHPGPNAPTDQAHAKIAENVLDERTTDVCGKPGESNRF